MSEINKPSWKDELKEAIPFLGHRNWIGVMDMAYPLQTQPGIKTIYTGESYFDVLSFVHKEIEKAPHIKPVIYQDKEFSFMSDDDAAGVDALRQQMQELLGSQAIPVMHEQLIARLDEVSRMFNVIILKTNLTIPYTSTFFALECDYWKSEKEEALQKRIK